MSEQLVENKKETPRCVGFIMDGNRRWATDQTLPTLAGHKAGEEVFYDSVKWVKEFGISHAVYYAFSTENWSRTKEEVDYLMELFLLFLGRILNEIDTVKVGVRIIGRKGDLSPKLQELIAKLENVSAKYLDATIWVAISYGGRAEVVEACNQAIALSKSITEEELGALLYTNGMPDPDLIIRTGGERRLSNFLPWQSVYSELFFTDTYWPAFTKDEFTRIVGQYGDRQRRRGK